MEMCRQLEEVLSWRLETEIWRRFPDKFHLIESHPCGGTYDSLVMSLRSIEGPSSDISLNRGGSLHLMSEEFRIPDVFPDWEEAMLQENPEKFLDKVCEKIGWEVPEQLPESTPETLVYRYISDFLAHSFGRKEYWECRNGQLDSSGYVFGQRRELFEKFKGLEEIDRTDHPDCFIGIPFYDFWFLMKDEEPFLCFEKSGILHLRNGKTYSLAHLYKKTKRIWPMIYATAGGLLP